MWATKTWKNIQFEWSIVFNEQMNTWQWFWNVLSLQEIIICVLIPSFAESFIRNIYQHLMTMILGRLFNKPCQTCLRFSRSETVSRTASTTTATTSSTTTATDIDWRKKSVYPWFLPVQTRWLDNDQEIFINNTTFKWCDTKTTTFNLLLLSLCWRCCCFWIVT